MPAARSPATFLAQVRGVAATLPAARMRSTCARTATGSWSRSARAVRGQVNLLPPSRAPAVVDEVLAQHADSYCLGDGALRSDAAALLALAASVLPQREARRRCWTTTRWSRSASPPAAPASPQAQPEDLGELPRQHRAEPAPRWPTCWPATAEHHRTWSPPCRRSTCTAWSCRCCCRCSGRSRVHAARPFFPDDIARALRDAPAPPLLVTTPVHLRALVESGRAVAAAGRHRLRDGAVAGRNSPLAAEARFGCEVREVFGSTETCVIARRRTAHRIGVDAAARRAPGAAARRHRRARRRTCPSRWCWPTWSSGR